MTALDHETTVLDDLDFAVPCEHAGCDSEAEWVLRWKGIPCCRPTGLVCTCCRDRAREWLRRLWRRRGSRVRCSHHGVYAPAITCYIDADPLDPR